MNVKLIVRERTQKFSHNLHVCATMDEHAASGRGRFLPVITHSRPHIGTLSVFTGTGHRHSFSKGLCNGDTHLCYGGKEYFL